MSWSTESNQINFGDMVYGNDGQKIGSVAEVQPGYIVVEKGFFFPTDHYIPISAVANASAGAVSLNVARDAALHSGWETVPDTDAVLTDIDVTATEGSPGGGQAGVASYEVASDELRIPVVKEELTATVREQEAGAVRVKKRVVEEDRVLEVPVTDERMRVERRIVDRPVGANETQAFEEIVIEMPLSREQVERQKREEIVVSKEAVQRTERVSDTVRREEVCVDEDAGYIDDTEDGLSGHH